MSSKKYVVNKQKVCVTLVNGKNLEGYINIKKYERLSDIFTKDSAEFIILYDIEYTSNEPDECYIINKRQIMYVQPMNY